MRTWCCIVIIMTTISTSALLPAPQKAEVKEPYDRLYWYAQAQETLQKRLQYATDKNPVAKNIILVVGDGMSLTTATAARILRGQRQGQSGEDTDLAWDTFPAVALAKTYNIDAQTGESSACATALLCGVKARFETLGLDAGGRFNNCASTINSKVTSLIDWAHEAGKSSGIVTTARITHATPAALYAHAPSRYWEDDSRVPPTVRKDCKDIALQLVENEPGRSINVIMGGGRRHFIPNVTPDPEHPNREGRRLDGRNLAEDWAREKKRRRLRAQYIYSKEHLAKLDPRAVDYVLGLFEYSHMEFNAERGAVTDAEDGTTGAAVKADDPSLADMTRAALSILTKNDKGFFLLLEGGRIDHAHHYNNPYRALDETLELETALLAALERVNPTETLIVVTADHGHVMTFGGQATPRGHPVLGADTVASDIDGLRYTTLLYGTGPGHSEPRALPLNSTASAADAVHASAVPRQWATHGAEDVPIYALGPMATILFTGVVEQSYIPHAIAYAACFAHHSRRCQDKSNFTQPPIKLPKCVSPEVSSISAADETRSDGSSGRRIVVASSVMSDERAQRSSAPLVAQLIANCYLIRLNVLPILLSSIRFLI
ncbi:alkaline phosphatase-like isoform X1 [Plodia interpunctella]|uniref:alkaline phosphatase-like isoform X1 n=2 Tax=Plodia interpunctella TaxID=58824 RepID=UPI0023674D1B|nr:alkaline phosphatase-like isoform X1 [Plodia interpunctella]XP_053604609.1 alkaline phosphatase-like isoform X1 [Plodia interpunctella]XP_053604610.1 alkaline phosphatase-like isoform X1 [Plodia interpunctella]XP_053604611.1 alkaline phosphatase-like isoform X1 [Plodia interpunctella]XP_053604612.1 alkaline phosphatase-like isoform X1 [Plodia interpunctella]XP_053604613.1 alkaline phosphatase-like isoform X1 [Plodia interpunctella]XP_053604614.1 alkaline phosphatase-like isoform X1 [Plodia